MSLWRPDPTFYPSPKMAMAAPPEKLAYVAMLNANGHPRPDALGVVDVDPQSSGYGRLVGQLDMPNDGDELHHFGWNACSASLCPYAPHPHIERRYLVVPGHQFVAHSHHRYQTGSAKASHRQSDRTGRRWPRAPATPLRTPFTADPKEFTPARWAQPTAMAPAAFS